MKRFNRFVKKTSRTAARATRLLLQPLEDRITPVIYTVTSTANSGAGTLRDALALSNASTAVNDTINITAIGTITLASPLSITDTVTINGSGYDLLAISGNNSVQVFTISGGSTVDVTISDLTIRNGSAASGGGVLSVADLTLDTVIVRNCLSSGPGGGIFSDGSLTLNNSGVRDNSAATRGGGIAAQPNGSTTLLNAEVVRNTASSEGGGIFTDSLAGNHTVLIRNSTLSTNSAGGNGGGFNGFNWNAASSFTMNNSTVTANSAANGGGLRVTTGGAVLNITSSVIAENTKTTSAPDIFAGTVNLTKSLVFDKTGFTTGTDSGNLAAGTDPGLSTLGSHGGPTLVHNLFSNSPLIDKGSNPSGFLTDQRGAGHPRVLNTIADIGAYETGSITVRNANDSGISSLRQVILDNNANPGFAIISFDSAFFNIPRTITLTSGELPVSDSLSINSAGNPNVTISGNNASRIFNLAASTDLTLESLVLTNGSTIGQGGAIFLTSGSMLALSDCTIQNNTAGACGGIAAIGSTAVVSITDSIIKNNTATFSVGGGIGASGLITLTRSTVSGNSAYDFGGAIYARSLVLESSTISSNTAGERGGGLLLCGPVPAGGSYVLRNSTLSGNVAVTSSGGAVSLGLSATNPFDSELLVRNSTITDNSGSLAGGIRRTFGTGSIRLDSTIISGNGNSPDVSSSGLVNVNFSAIGVNGAFTLTGANNLPFGIDLKLSPLGDHGGPTATHRPNLGSPVIDQGSNLNDLSTDQRGFIRYFSGIDIGAVEVAHNSVSSITRVNPNPTALASVSWTVAMPIAGFGSLLASNFKLSGPGAVGAAITSVTGTSGSYTVTATTAAEGLLTLTFDNDDGDYGVLTNLPFLGASYSVDKLDPVNTNLFTNDLALNDSNVGPGQFYLKARYSEAMNTSVAPLISFPAAGENPSGTLVVTNAEWEDETNYKVTYNVNDLNISLADIDIRVSGGKDQAGSIPASKDFLNALDIDTRNPTAVSILRDNPNPTNAATVNWTVTFSEAITGLAKANLSLFNGGLNGTPTITALSGSGTTYTVTASTGGGEGTLTLVVDNGAGVTDGVGNVLANTPISGGAYSVDHVSPAASTFNLNTLLVSDANVGPNGFTATLKYNELMNTAVSPTVSFPAEFPNSLTASGGVWLDARTYQTKFNVADLGVTQSNIDIRFSGAVDVVGNEQAQFDAVDVFDIDTQNPVVSSIISATANGTYGVGATIDVTLNFSEQVNLVGTLNVTLDTGAVVSIVGPQSGTSLSGTYTVSAGQNSPDLNVTNLALTGGSTLRDDATNTSVLTLPASNLANNAAIVISTGAGGPVVTGFVVNDGAVQRSRLTKIVVNFASPVNAAQFQTLGAVSFTRTGIPTNNIGAIGTVVNASNGLQISPASGTVSSITLTFANVQNSGVDFGSLADGRWQLAVTPAGYTSPNGPGDVQLRRFFGNFDNDTQVGGTDFGFYPPFGAATNNPFDFNYDGAVLADDFGEFGNRFGFTLV